MTAPTTEEQAQAPAPARRASAAARTAIVVLGMHRSGTSALAGLIHRLGADGPATPLGPNAHNPKGHFESRSLYLLQDELLESAGSAWDDYRPLPAPWMTSPKADEFRERLVAMVGSEYGQSGFFVVKDPRICRLVPLWRQVLAELEVVPRFVHIHRNPLEVARSLEKRDGLDPAYGQLVWLRHLLDAEIGSRGETRSFLGYDALLEDWPAEMEKVGADLGISWPKFAAAHGAELDAMVLPDLKHNTGGALLRSRLSARWISGTHDVFDRWSRSGEDPADHTLLDEIRRAFDESCDLFNATVHARGRSLVAELDRAREETATGKAQAAEGEAMRDTLVRERDEARAGTEAAEARMREAAEAAEALRADRDALAARLSTTESMLAQRAAEIDDARNDVEAARETLAATEDRAAEADRALAGALARIDELEAAIDRRDGDLARMQVLLLDAGIAADAVESAPEGAPARLRRPAPARSDPLALPDPAALSGGNPSDRQAVKELLLERNQARAALKQAELRTEELLNSSSWRVTAPIRWLVLRFRR